MIALIEMFFHCFLFVLWQLKTFMINELAQRKEFQCLLIKHNIGNEIEKKCIYVHVFEQIRGNNRGQHTQGQDGLRLKMRKRQITFTNFPHL